MIYLVYPCFEWFRGNEAASEPVKQVRLKRGVDGHTPALLGGFADFAQTLDREDVSGISGFVNRQTFALMLSYSFEVAPPHSRGLVAIQVESIYSDKPDGLTLFVYNRWPFSRRAAYCEKTQTFPLSMLFIGGKDDQVIPLEWPGARIHPSIETHL